LIECVANLSEGRDAATIAGMAAAIRSTGSALLDVHSDVDHHRSVFTFAGTADEAVTAAVRLAGEAVARIDLRTHRGVHPRIGALDVVPFVPVDGATIDECVTAARLAGRTIADDTRVPVFLYGLAASQPARASLAALRRGGLDGLRERIGRAEWIPDFGPTALHPSAGATAVGARPPLVAYNVCLDSCDLAVGKRIAAAARSVNGGPRGVQALAFLLERRGCVQISMNLTEAAPGIVAAAFDRVRWLAEACGVGIASSEIVGLAPLAALLGATSRQLLLDDRIEDHVLESRWGK